MPLGAALVLGSRRKTRGSDEVRGSRRDIRLSTAADGHGVAELLADGVRELALSPPRPQPAEAEGGRSCLDRRVEGLLASPDRLGDDAFAEDVIRLSPWCRLVASSRYLYRRAPVGWRRRARDGERAKGPRAWLGQHASPSCRPSYAPQAGRTA